MKASFFNARCFYGWLTGLLVAAAIVFATLPAHAVTSVDSATGTVRPPTPTSQGVVLSPGARDVLRMVQAKVSPQVITAYVKSSATSFNLSATDIIVLRHLGVTDDVLAAMLERSGELRAQSVADATAYATSPAPIQPEAATPAVAPYMPAPDYSYAAGPTPYYDYSYVDPYSYAASSYYPYSWGYGYSYPINYPYSGYWGCSYGYCGYHGCYHTYPGHCYYTHGYYGHGYPGHGFVGYGHRGHDSGQGSHLYSGPSFAGPVRTYSGPTFSGPRSLYSGPTFAGPNNLIHNAPMGHFAGHTIAGGGLAMHSAAITRSAAAVRSGGGHR